MRKRVRLATTAGMTVLGFTAMSGMSGMAQADTGGLGLSDLTGSVGKTVDGVVKQVTGSSGGSARTEDSGGSGGAIGLRLSLPVHVQVGGSGSSGHSAPVAKAKAGVKADVKAAPVAAHARVNLGLCVGSPQQCGGVPGPPTPVPPTPPPPAPPPTPPTGNPPSVPPGAAGAGATTIGGDSLPFTGAPLAPLALLGATAVVTGAAGVAGSRIRANRG